MSDHHQEPPDNGPLRKVDLRRNRHAPIDRGKGQPDPMDELLDASDDEEFPEGAPDRE